MERSRAVAPKADDLLLREYDHAWHHYRQMESRSGQYVGFLFALAVGTGSLVAQVATSSQAVSVRLVEAAAVVGIFHAASLAVFMALKKLWLVAAFYESVLGRIRRHFYGDDEVEWPVTPVGLNIRSAYGTNALFRRRVFSIARGSWNVAFGCALLAAITEMVLAWRVFGLDAPGWHKTIGVAIFALGGVGTGGLRWLLRNAVLAVRE